MPSPSILSRVLLSAGQSALPLVCLVAIGFTPPAEGRVLLVPTSVGARAMLIAVATDHGARLVERGPISGSIIVEGMRDELAAPMLSHGILPLRAPRGGCGDERGARA